MVFEKAIFSGQVFNVLNECLISKDLLIIRKKADTVLISVYSSCTAENFKVIMSCAWGSPTTTRYNHLKKQGSNFTSLVALNFSTECDVLLFDFSSA